MRHNGALLLAMALDVNNLTRLSCRFILVTLFMVTLFACDNVDQHETKTVLNVALPSLGPELLDPSMDEKS